MKLHRTFLLATLLGTVIAPAAWSDPPVTKVEAKVVKFDDLAKVVRQNAGKVVVVDFWADYCIPCKKNFPHVVEMYKKYADRGLVVISVDVDDNVQTAEVQNRALSFLREKNATFTNFLLDEPSDVWTKKLDVEVIPTVFVFNRAGKWKKFTDKVDPADVEKQVVEFLNEK